MENNETQINTENKNCECKNDGNHHHHHCQCGSGSGGCGCGCSGHHGHSKWRKIVAAVIVLLIVAMFSFNMGRHCGMRHHGMMQNGCCEMHGQCGNHCMMHDKDMKCDSKMMKNHPRDTTKTK